MEWRTSGMCLLWISEQREFPYWPPEQEQFRPPSRLQRLIGLLAYWFFLVLAMLIPARWVVDESIRESTRRGRFAIWAYGRAYRYPECAWGRV